MSFAAIEPAIKFTIDGIKDIAHKQKPLKQLKEDLVDKRLFECEMALGENDERILVNLTERYAHLLVENITNRFSNSLPVLTAFTIFDPLALTDRSDEAFKEYGNCDINILADHFYQCEENKEELKEEFMCEWRKFKYNLLKLKSDIPLHVLKPQKNMTSSTPTEWLLNHSVGILALIPPFFPLSSSNRRNLSFVARF